VAAATEELMAGEAPPPRRIEPGPGQESVWDYPRPPRIEPSRRRARVEFAGVVIADSVHALRCLETAGPPTIYIPIGDVDADRLSRGPRTTVCEWKGTASYFDIVVGERVAQEAAWWYADPRAGYEMLADHLSFYPGRVDGCWLDDEVVRPQPGRFYGGWITDDIVGPFKGEPGSEGW